MLGVGFVASTYIYTDTINAAFSSIFDDAFAGIDAQVSSESEFSFSDPPLLDESVADAVAAVPGVATAVPSLQRAGVKFIDDEGEPISNGGAPNFGGYYSEELGDSFLGLEIAEGGRAPTAPNEVVVDAGTADDHELSVGDSVDIISTTTAARPFDVVGIVRFAGLDNLGGSTFALFDLPTIQGLVGAEGQIDSVIVLSDPGADIDTLVAEIQRVLPEGAIAESAQDAAEADAADIQEGLAFFGTFLNTFGFIALFVGTFIIANTFRIVVVPADSRVGTAARPRGDGAPGAPHGDRGGASRRRAGIDRGDPCWIRVGSRVAERPECVRIHAAVDDATTPATDRGGGTDSRRCGHLDLGVAAGPPCLAGRTVGCDPRDGSERWLDAYSGHCGRLDRRCRSGRAVSRTLHER